MKKITLLLALFLSLQTHAEDATNALVLAIAETPELSIQTLSDGRNILTSQDGLSLYTFDKDAPGISNCHGGCLVAWPAVVAETEILVQPFSAIVSSEGVRQLALGNKALYFYIQDEIAGDIFGEGIGGVWHLVEVK